MANHPKFYRGDLDHKVTTVSNGACVNADFAAFVQQGPWAKVKTWKVEPRIHTITGFGLSNYTFIEGDTGLILVDTGLNNGSGLEILRMKEAFSDKPISAIIYTHHHYTAGTQAIIEGFPDGPIPVFGHPNVDSNLLRVFSETAIGAFRRGFIQFGAHLPTEGPDAAFGIAEPQFEDPELNARGHVPVSHPVADGEDIVIDGVRTVFHHAIADTDDSLIIHFPELDAVVHNTAVMPFLFPMYTLRGDFFRSPPDILASIDALRTLEPEHLIGCHGLPVSGRDTVQQTATVHRDALALIYQQTVQGINLGLDPLEIAQRVRLPEALNRIPELFCAYVDIEHMVRGIYGGIIGWWANDPADLHPPAEKEIGEEIIKGFGGTDQVLERAKDVLSEGRYNLAAALATYVLSNNPDHPDARSIKATALRQMGYAAPTGIQSRNFLLTEARRLEGQVEIDCTLRMAPSILSAESVAELPPETFLPSLTFAIDAEFASNLVLSVAIQFTDPDRAFTLHIRNGACELTEGSTQSHDLTLRLSKATWALLATGQKRLEDLLQTGTASLIGDEVEKDAFLKAFNLVL